MPVSFNTLTLEFAPKNKARIKKWIASVISKEKKQEGKIAYIFCSDKELLKINKEFLNHSTLTDIITFDYSEGKLISGEIYISVERVMENSIKFKTEFKSELQRVMIHGVLHLCGYGDKSSSEKKLMREKENKALLLF
jgi:probable rRNA maturation factor